MQHLVTYTYRIDCCDGYLMSQYTNRYSTGMFLASNRSTVNLQRVPLQNNYGTKLSARTRTTHTASRDTPPPSTTAALAPGDERCALPVCIVYVRDASTESEDNFKLFVSEAGFLLNTSVK